ncbi:MAG: FtsB family cell division protein [Acidimicrobiales bacterium]
MTAARATTRSAPRRSRVAFGVAGLLAVLIVVTGMPISALLTQHREVSQAAAQLTQLQQTGRALQDEARTLSDPAKVDGLARTEYGLAPPGQKVYVILPPAGSSASTVSGSGHIPLDGPPVEPGSAQSRQLLGVQGSLGDQNGSRVPSTSAGRGSGRRARASGGGFWERVAHALEFWN